MLRTKIAMLTGLLLLGLGLQAQMAKVDSIPTIVEGPFDWNRFLAGEERFSQKDLVMYIIRKEGVHQMFEQERDQDWVQDFHFKDLNGDRVVDAIYSGETKAKGMYSMVLLSDSGMTWPLAFEAAGYIHDFRPSVEGIVLTLREDATESHAVTRMAHYQVDFAADSVRTIWTLQMLRGTELPTGALNRRAIVLRRQSVLRTFPSEQEEPGVDYTGDHSPDLPGNMAGEFPGSTQAFRLYETERDGRNWSFVIYLSPPLAHPVFRQVREGIDAYAGWLPSELLEVD